MPISEQTNASIKPVAEPRQVLTPVPDEKRETIIDKTKKWVVAKNKVYKPLPIDSSRLELISKILRDR